MDEVQAPEPPAKKDKAKEYAVWRLRPQGDVRLGGARIIEWPSSRRPHVGATVQEIGDRFVITTADGKDQVRIPVATTIANYRPVGSTSGTKKK